MSLIWFIRRDSAERYLSVVLISFAGSVSLTRLFLSLTGYPQIGGGDLHIAHAIWGGLLLFIAALLPLIIANRGVYPTSAVIAGIGVGLFIDEVGKFITQKNDYFYPAAAPIIYVFFLLTILLLLNLRHISDEAPNIKLHQAIDHFQDMLVGPVNQQEYSLVKTRLEQLINDSNPDKHADLAQAILHFIQEDAPPTPSTEASPHNPLSQWIQKALTRLLTDDFLRISLIVGLLAIGLLTLKNPVQVIFADWLPPALLAFLENFYSGRRIDPTSSSLLFGVRVFLEVIIGSMFVASAVQFIRKYIMQGIRFAFLALILSLTTVNVLLFYFEQFSTIMTTLIQFILLAEVVYYQNKLKSSG